MINGKKTIIIFIASALLFSVIILSGCSSAPGKSSAPSTAPTQSAAPSTVLVTSEDKNISIDVPAGWNTNDMSLSPSGSAIIGVSNNQDYQYLIITRRAKSDFAANFNLNDYMADLKKDYDIELINPVWGQISSTTIGGCNALSVEVNGTTLHGKAEVYWISAIEGKNNYYCVSGWTPKSKSETNQQIIESVINSFKETTYS
jgi:DnaJ-class molecular chaperone